MIPLRGSAVFKGKGGTGKKIISIVLFPIGWLIKGSDIEFPEGKNLFRPVIKDDTPLKYQK
jgi:MinD superfamily P-loop ATPase